jgi:hypothetical protein
MGRAAVLKSSNAVNPADRVCSIHCRCAPDRGTSHAPTGCAQNQKQTLDRQIATRLLPGGRRGRPRSRFSPEGVGADRDPASARRAWEQSEVTTAAMERAAVLKSSNAVNQAGRVCSIHCRFAPDRGTSHAPTGCAQNQKQKVDPSDCAPPSDGDPASARRTWGLTAIPLLPGGRWGRPRSRFSPEGVGADRNSASARRA